MSVKIYIPHYNLLCSIDVDLATLAALCGQDYSNF